MDDFNNEYLPMAHSTIQSMGRELAHRYSFYNRVASDPQPLVVHQGLAVAARDSAMYITRELVAFLQTFEMDFGLPLRVKKAMADHEVAYGDYITDYALYIVENVRAGERVADDTEWRASEDRVELAALALLDVLAAELLPEGMQFGCDCDHDDDEMPLAPAGSGLVN